MSVSGITMLIISTEEIKEIKIVKSLEDSGLLIKRITQTTENEETEWKGGFLGILLGRSGANLSKNIIVVKTVIRASDGVTWAGQEF